MNLDATKRLFDLGQNVGKERWCYLAGPMRGKPGLNREAFDRAAKTLRDYGWHVFNPSETDAEVKDAAEASPNPLSVYMQQDLVDVCKSNVVFVLEDWARSEGAVLEVTVAFKLKIPVYAFPQIERVWTNVTVPQIVFDFSTEASREVEAEKVESANFSRRVLDYVKPNGEATVKKFDRGLVSRPGDTERYSEWLRDQGKLTKTFDHEKGHFIDTAAGPRLTTLKPIAARPPLPEPPDTRLPVRPTMDAVTEATVRLFSSGATRNPDTNKPDFEGFISPLVVDRFGRYMHAHRLQADGTLRSSDNWQKGMPLEAYMKSMWRHFLHVWLLHRGHEAKDYDTGEPVSLEDALCGLSFNTNGYLLEVLKDVPVEEVC